jgi:hypothetical protein
MKSFTVVKSTVHSSKRAKVSSLLRMRGHIIHKVVYVVDPWFCMYCDVSVSGQPSGRVVTLRFLEK